MFTWASLCAGNASTAPGGTTSHSGLSRDVRAFFSGDEILCGISANNPPRAWLAL
ncbi:hypothetical protein CGRA01v4_11697 [Colletotrichum graminicola]|nr:hypothetical protein CGRA01v4_11697 [Colletotrichum graminicola]